MTLREACTATGLEDRALDHDELAFHLNRILGDFDVQAARREVLEVDPAPVLENLAWIRRWITRFLR